MARSTGDATSEQPKHVKRKPKEASSSGRELEAGTYEQLLYLLTWVRFKTGKTQKKEQCSPSCHMTAHVHNNRPLNTSQIM
jgi:hypothetical protein